MHAIDHLLVLAPGFPAHDADTVCLPYFQDYLIALRTKYPALKVSVIAFQYPYRTGKYTWKGVDVYPMGGKNRRWCKPWVWRKARRTFQKIHRETPVQAIHSLWLLETAWLGGKLARKFGCAHVATAMGQDVFARNRYLRKLDFEAMTLVALSTRSAEMLQQHAHCKVDAILQWFVNPVQAADQLAAQIRDVDVLGVGSLVALKKYDRFLRVVRLLRDRKPDLRVVLIGEGPERKKLEALAQELRIQDCVEFLGLKARDEVMAWMARSKVFLHPSAQEGQGYVYVEALAQGMHIVSSPIGMAETHEKWAVYMDAVRQSEAVLRFLQAPVDFAPRMWVDADAVMEAYMRMYAWKSKA